MVIVTSGSFSLLSMQSSAFLGGVKLPVIFPEVKVILFFKEPSLLKYSQIFEILQYFQNYSQNLHIFPELKLFHEPSRLETKSAFKGEALVAGGGVKVALVAWGGVIVALVA